MAPRSLWTGSLSFGLVNVPVAMFSGVADRDLHARLLHANRAAVELIESFACPWDPSRYEDAFQKRLREIVKRKGKGQAIELPEEEEEVEEEDQPSPVPDLMAALERSLEEAKS